MENLYNDNILWTILRNQQIKEDNFFHVCGEIEIAGGPTVIYTPPTGTRFYITDIFVSVDNDNIVQLREGTNGCRSIFVFNVDTQANTSFNGGHSFSMPYRSEINGEIRIITSTTAKVNYSVQGYFK